MALTEEEKREIKEDEKSMVRLIPINVINNQKYGFPALLSFFIPGLGQIIKDQIGRGILIFLGFFFGLFMLLVPGIVIWIWQISDAYDN